MQQRLYTLKDGLPALGLLILRLVVGAGLIVRGVRLHDLSLHTLPPHVIAAGAGLLLIFGLWTSVAGVVLAISELLIAFSLGHDPWLSVLLASLGVALALLGPGAWSIDARHFGWKRIEIRRPEN
jgi:uncharacterized membrane protein YphA (DoxX/SURF4 family)